MYADAFLQCHACAAVDSIPRGIHVHHDLSYQKSTLLEAVHRGVPLVLPSKRLLANNVVTGKPADINICNQKHFFNPLADPLPEAATENVDSIERILGMLDYYAYPSVYTFDSFDPHHVLARIDEIIADMVDVAEKTEMAYNSCDRKPWRATR